MNRLRLAQSAVIALVLIVAAAGAQAATVVVNWSHPTQYQDGTPLPLASIASTLVEIGTCGVLGSFGAVEVTRTVAAPATTVSITTPRFGEYCARLKTTTVGGATSDYSLVAQRLYPEPQPKPPIVTLATVVYELRFDFLEGPRLGKAVGTVGLGVECGADPLVYRGWRAMHEVSLDRVTLDRMPASPVVVAACGNS